MITPELNTFEIDPTHSFISFEVPHLAISTIEGQFKKFEGSISTGKNISDLKIESYVEIDSIDTSVPDRDLHLKSADFFDAIKFPQMSFISMDAFGTHEKLKIRGNLNIKGTTKEVIFESSLSKEVVDPWGKTRIAISGVAKINRQEFGLTWNNIIEAGQVIGDQVTIHINAEAIKS
jgi:polyisoprenoid-binding protein YceI